MKTVSYKPQSKRYSLGGLTVLSSGVLFIQINPALANDTIVNTADADYTVAEHQDVVQKAKSNDVQAFVVPQYKIALTQPLTITVKPGDSVTWKNTLTNVGSDATIDVKFTAPSSLSNVEIYVDLNKNGVIDSNEKPLTPTISLKAQEQIELIVKALVSSTAKDGDTASVVIDAVTKEDPTAKASATDSLIVVKPYIGFKDPDFDKDKTTPINAGDPVYIEAGLASCNANPNEKDYVWITVKSKATGDTITLKAVETGNNTGKYRASVPTEFNANANPNDNVIQTIDGDTLDAQAISCEDSGGNSTKPNDITDNWNNTQVDVQNPSSNISISKEANVQSVEVGDFVDYTINVNNLGATALSNVKLLDNLPTGFTYVKGSVRINGQKYNQDFVQSGKYMTLGLSSLPANDSKKISYRVLVGPSALSGDGINRAHITATDTNNSTVTSREATATIKVTSGALNTDGIIVGKVYADFNRDGIQQKERNELGVAGVRLYLEDGTFAVTDSEGKYSLYGIKAKTHVIKLDRTTLPRGVELIEQSNRNMGDPGSRFVDLKYGELHRADFAITDGMDEGSQSLIDELKKRSKLVIKNNTSLEQALKTELEFEPSYQETTSEIEASGCKDDVTIDGQNNCDTVIYGGETHYKHTPKMEIKTITPVKELEIEKALSTEDDKRIEGVTRDADFLNLTDGQHVTAGKIRVQIKAPQGANTQLFVNDKLVDNGLMAKEVAWEKEQISGFDYFAVPLDAGDNTLTIKSTDNTGKIVSSKSIHVYAPNKLSEIATRTQGKFIEADGVSEYQIVVSLKDVDHSLYGASTSVSLDSDIGTIMLPDADKDKAGIQTTINGGELLVPIKAPATAGKGNLLVRAGNLEKLVPLQFTPQLRPMIAVGVVEGVLSLNNLGSGLEKATSNDGFEEELQSLSGNKSDKTSTHGRAAFFLKGKVRGDFLLTLAYDSDKHDKDRLFRDIRPDEYYPVYGDASAKGFDAQSASKLYVRLDKGRSFAMYGDIKTHVENDEGLSLGQYDRTLTGLKGHLETDKTTVSIFAAEANSSQKVNETRGLGISGPYPIGANFDDVLVNSETVEIITRDRNNPGVILSRKSLSRFSDYDVDALSKALYLRSPIASQDLNGNPMYLRITVEARNTGDSYIVGGVSGSHQLTNNIRIGASYVQSDDPANSEKLASVNTVVKFTDNLKLIAETARYDSDKVTGIDDIASQVNADSLGNKTSGDATRVELVYQNNTNNARLYYTDADKGFGSMSSPLTAGRTEIGLSASSALNDKTRIKAEALQTEDHTVNTTRTGADVSIERKLTDIFTGEVGVRYYEKDAGASSTNYQAVTQTDINNQSLRPSVTHHPRDYNGTTVRGKLTAELPKVNKSKVFVEYEQDIEDAGRNAWSVGGETSLWNKGRLYARHELSSSLIGDYGFDDNDEHKTTVIGVDSNYMQDGQVFSEYRVKDGISARDAEASIGLRNKWKVKDGLYFNTSLEHLESLEGRNNNTATAITAGVDYLANEKYKFTTRTEKRWGEQTDTFLHTFGLANKINDDITVLAKNNFSLQEDNASNKRRTLDRFQLGMAYRDYDSNVLDHLAKLEYRYDNNQLASDPYKKQTYIASLHTNYHPVRRWTLSGHYAGKYNKLVQDDVATDATTHLISGRAMYDINERWNAGVQVGTMWTDENDDLRYLVGAEVGYSPMTNLWLSLGYNFTGYKDNDIANSDENQQGAFFRLRFKFDEDLFKRKDSRENTRLEPSEQVKFL